MSDYISRQAAIDALGEKPFAGTGDEYDYEQGLQNQWERDVVAIKILPYAQPEIIRCKDCKYAHLTNDGKSCKYCDQFTDDYGQVMEMYFDSDFYCGYAERRTDD